MVSAKRFTFLILLTLLLLQFSATKVFSQAGDTVRVQTFTFGSPQDAWFLFPKDTVKFEKILMRYTLKCNPAQNPPCGEWDYLTYSYLFEHTGKQDSTLLKVPFFTADGNAPNTISYRNTPSYIYKPFWQRYTNFTDTNSLAVLYIGKGNTNSTIPFGVNNPVSRAQFLWRASELNAANLKAGNISGLQFYVKSKGSSMRFLTVKLKAAIYDSVKNAFDNTGFTTVFSANTQFLDTGWQNIAFTTNCNWDGKSNLLADISYDNFSAGTDNIIAADTNHFLSSVYMQGNERSFSFSKYGYINVPVKDVSEIDSFITVSYWSFGNVAKQPMEGTSFEAVDKSGNRVINVHGPWGDNKMYWDAGNSGGASADRITKQAATTETEGKWNYWTFTKNVATGSMKIYLNGNLWHSAGNMKKRMYGISQFRIGQGNWDGSQTYEGKIDEFAVWNTELDAATIKSYMNKSLDQNHPANKNLLVYYKGNDENGLQAKDASGKENHGDLVSVDNPLTPSTELFLDVKTTNIRPQIAFQQGSFTGNTANAFSVDGNTFSVDAANDRIGIGTATPANKLHVNGTDPLRLEGITSGNSSTDRLLVADTNGVVKSIGSLGSLSVPTPAIFRLESAQTNFLNGVGAGASSVIPMTVVKNSIPGLTYNTGTSTITFPAGSYQMTVVYEATHNNTGCTLSSYIV
ncbi:MAG: LamG domain-containing protein, partial [Sphingobacteriales bacterium]